MNLTSPVSQLATRSRPAPADLLGPGHPLVRDLERLAVARRQSLIVGAVLVGSVAALAEGFAAAAAVVAAAVVTELLLGGRALALLENRRRHVLDVIADGRHRLPIHAVERMCVRLRRPHHRRRLRRSVAGLVAAELGAFDVVTTPWRLLSAELVAPIRCELTEIATMLGDEDAGVAGIAMLERLLFDGTSSLHGDDPQLVREDLRRVRFLLGAR